MPENLFPESTTYIHSYPPHELKSRVHSGPPNASIVEYVPNEQVKKTKSSLKDRYQNCKLTSIKSTGTKSVAKKDPSCTTFVGRVAINNLPEHERNLFVKQSYTTSYNDYAKPDPSLASWSQRAPFSPKDKDKLASLRETKPDLHYYGFGLPSKSSVLWGTAQCRTLPNETRKETRKSTKADNPFVGYPEKMYPFISTHQLNPHYDGSFTSGYTGHQRHYLNYPDDVKAILRRNFPQHIPRDVTTNESHLIHQPIPKCEDTK